MMEKNLLVPSLPEPKHDSSLRRGTLNTLLQVPQKGVQTSASFEDLVEIDGHRRSDSSDSVSSGGEGEPTELEGAVDLPQRRKLHKESLQTHGMKSQAMKYVQRSSIQATSSDPSLASLATAGVAIRVRKPSSNVRLMEAWSSGDVSSAKQLQEHNKADIAQPPTAASQPQARKRKRPILLDMHRDAKFDDLPGAPDKRQVDQSTGER